jgi:hypothetical protein
VIVSERGDQRSRAEFTGAAVNFANSLKVFLLNLILIFFGHFIEKKLNKCNNAGVL